MDTDEQVAFDEMSDEERREVGSGDEDYDVARSHIPGRRLWQSRVVYPRGVAKWDNTENCEAALRYECPCSEPCLARVGDILLLYEHRRKFRGGSQKVSSGVLRDTLRDQLEAHYDAQLGHFSNSFVVGGVGRICERAYAVATGVSETTYVRARGDVTKKRAKHAGRVQVKVQRVSEARAHLDAWVRAQRNSMEGDKSTGLKWFTEKVTEKQLWHRYMKGCDKAQVRCNNGCGLGAA